MKIPPIRILGGLAVALGASLTPATAQNAADGTNLKVFESGQVWKFERVNGSGSFELGKDGETPMGILSYDFSQFPDGQRYVMASTGVHIPAGTKSLQVKMKAANPRKVAIRVVDETGQTHQFKREVKSTGQWETVTLSLTGKAEHWKGANDGVIHFPITALVLVAPAMTDGPATGKVQFADLSVERGQAPVTAKRNEEYLEFNFGGDTGGLNWVQSITVSEPPLRSEVEGKVTVNFQAPGMTHAKALCWSQPTEKNPNPWGHDAQLTPEDFVLGSDGGGSFTFSADEFPNGPMNVRILASNESGKKDIFELQLFNKGGVKWNQGIPETDPPAAKGLKLIFADDFTEPLSISNDGRGARYNAHKPRFGDFSGWPFSDVLGDGKPFSQTGTWLKISARKDAESPKGRTGLIASVDMDGKGVWAKAPAYLECRFTAQSAPGTWPAFWTLTHLDRGAQGDELDIIEAYGGVGQGNPNHPGYSIVSHFWRQTNPDGSKKKGVSTKPPITELGGKSYWSTTFHTYAVYIGLEETVYYFDDIEVLRHPTNDISRDYPHCFLINLAISGISKWPIDLARFGDGSDMWVDYVRVYAKEPVDYSLPPAAP